MNKQYQDFISSNIFCSIKPKRFLSGSLNMTLNIQLGYDIEALKITTQNLQNLLAVTQHYYIPFSSKLAFDSLRFINDNLLKKLPIWDGVRKS